MLTLAQLRCHLLQEALLDPGGSLQLAPEPWVHPRESTGPGRVEITGVPAASVFLSSHRPDPLTLTLQPPNPDPAPTLSAG